MTMNLRTTHVTLLCVLGGLGGCLQPHALDDDSSSSDPSSSSTQAPSSAASDAPSSSSSSTTDPTTADATDTSTTAPAGSCGDGVVDRDEECDDGTANADDAACTADCLRNACGDGKLWPGHEECDDGTSNADDAACTAACTVARCGDGRQQAGVEACDDGVNDGSYGSCAADCSARAAHCGDLVVDPEEECDSGEPMCLRDCRLATSCLRVHEAEPERGSGPAVVYPLGTLTSGVEVYCDMDTDGGGYTLLKVDIDSEVNDLPYHAKKAESTCAGYGMRLFIPRSAAHLSAAHAVAIGENVAPQGGGTKALGADYLQILGVYPLKAGVSCPGKPLQPSHCPQWVAGDGGPWYVSKTVVNAAEPDPAGACAGCSLIYTWNADGTVKNYKSLPAPGGSSLRFMCDVGDKRP